MAGNIAENARDSAKPTDLDARLARMNAAPGRWLVLFAGILAMQISAWWYPTPDACSYLSIARSMVADRADGRPVTNLGATQLWYPPGYPVLISPAFLFGDRPFLLLSVMQWAMAVAFLIGFYRWVRQQLPEAAVLISGLAVINLGVWIHYRRTLSEMAFMAVAIWTLNALTAVRRRSLAQQSVIVPAIGAGILVAALSLIRQAGLALAAGFLVAAFLDLIERRIDWRRACATVAAVTVPGFLAVLGLMRYEAQRSAEYGGHTYLANFDNPGVGLAGQLLEGVRLRTSDIGQVSLPFMFKSYAQAFQWLNINMAIYVVLAATMAVGWWRFVRTRRDIFALALPFYLLLYVTYGMEAGARFLVPVVGLLMICLWEALARLGSKRQTLFAGLLALHACAAFAYWLGVEMPRAREANRHWPEIEALAAQIEDRESLGAVVNCDESVQLMLELALDRRVARVDLPKSVDAIAASTTSSLADQLDPKVRWIAVSSQRALDPQFVVSGVAGDYAIWKKANPGEVQHLATPANKQPAGSHVQ